MIQSIARIEAVFPDGHTIQRTGQFMEEHWRGISKNGSRPVRYNLLVDPPGIPNRKTKE